VENIPSAIVHARRHATGSNQRPNIERASQDNAPKRQALPKAWPLKIIR
jgi:hypothetical protein